MEKKLKLEILDKELIKILSLLKIFKDDFYLAGGTGLALQIGHRQSVDFDFFALGDTLKSILEICNKKYHEFDQALYLKALLSYDDIEEAPINFLPGKEKNPKEVFTFIEKKVKLFLA